MNEKQKFKGTPGPWDAHCMHGDARIGSNGEAIAVAPRHADQKNWPKSANARLIAAAPDLLEALQAIAKDAPTDADFALGGKYDYEGAGNFGDDYDKGAAETHLWAAKIARAAIAKALGDD